MGVSFLESFWQRVDVRGPDDCWLWTAGRTNRGYGATYGPRSFQLLAHRVSWELANAAEVPLGLFVCHTCDVPPCVNPAHLFIGTSTENIVDGAKKGRLARTLSNDQVAEIRTLRAAGHSYTTIALMFHVDRGTVWNIAVRRRRRSVA